jgi:hypothetical protein
MSDTELKALNDKLAEGLSLGDALSALARPDERELLKRCAAVHTFDEELVEVLRTALPEAPESRLEQLVAAGSVEPVPGREGRYRLPAEARRTHYERWWADEAGSAAVPSRLRTLTERLTAHFAGRPGEDVELLYHELLLRPKAAIERFEALYAEADERFDVARCQDLLDVLTERLDLLGPELAAARNRYRRRLRARAIWMDEWYRSARFMPRAQSGKAIEALLAGGQSRALMLWSAGGMGKTSHLRWLIARRCVPAGIACARIDFDAVDPLLATRHPWLLLLEAAAQLDRQLPDAPFHELLAQYPGQRERLHSRAAPAAGPEANGVAADVGERFVTVLRELPSEQHVLLALDTLEEALLLGGSTREQTDLEPLLTELASLVRDAPALRLVLAGRYDLGERMSGFAELFPGVITLQLTSFDRQESQRYLTEHRGITRPDVVAAIVRDSDGIPFKLELISDVVEERPDLDAAELEGYANADLRYVMERVVVRLEPGLQWLLRYGVVPRVLDRSFVDEVLAPLLQEHGGGTLDGRWRALKRYAGTASWVTLDPLAADGVRFHPAVLGPMRALLRNSPHHDDLQRRARDAFAARAERDPQRATRWLREAVYHQFQLEGPAAEHYWRKQLFAARVARLHERRRELAADLLGPDYVDEDRPLPWRDGLPVIAEETLHRARWQFAVASLQLIPAAGSRRRDADWLEAARALADLEHLQRASRRPAVTEAQLALLRAGIRLVRGDVDGARPHVERALHGRLASEDRLWLWLALAAATSAAGLDEAAGHFKAALTFAERDARPEAACAEVYQRLARHHMDHDRLDRAVAACERGLKSATGRQKVELDILRAALALRLGTPSEALERLEAVECDEVEIEARRAILRVRATLASARPLDAITLAEDAGARFADTLERGGERQQALAAEGRELRGKARGAVLETEGALKDFDVAAARWSRLGSREGVCRCSVRGAALQLRWMGNLLEASMRLDQARRTGVERGGDAWTRCTLVGAELLGRTGEAARALRLVDDVIAALERNRRRPRAFIAAALQGLALSAETAPDRYLELLCDELVLVTPATARLNLLDGLARCAPLTGATPRLKHRLRRLVPAPSKSAAAFAHLPERDVALLSLRDAELDRVLGRADAARRTLEHAQRVLEVDAPRAARQAVLRTALRAEAQPVVESLGDRELGDLEAGRGGTPALDAAVALEAASRLADPGERARLLGIAQGLLEREGTPLSRWPAVLSELQAREAERGDRPEEARAHWLRAVELYEGLEDDAGRDRVLQQVTAKRRTLTADNDVRATIHLREGEMVVETEWQRRRQSMVADPGERPLVAALLRSPAVESGVATDAEIVSRLLDDPAAVGGELASLLLAAMPDGLAPTGGHLVDLGLRAKQAPVRALPWELAAHDLERAGLRLFRRAPRTRGEPGDVRALQYALTRIGHGELAVDGIPGPRTRSALEDAQRDLGMPVTGEADAVTVQRVHAAVTGRRAPRVAIVRPTRRAEELTFRGSRQGGVSLELFYERAGFRPDVLDGPTPEELEAELGRRPAAIVHMTVGLVDHHGTAALDLLAAPRTKGRPSAAVRLTATTLGWLIPRELPAPLVIVDVPAPPGKHEGVKQLLLRNAFAAEAMAVGTVRALLATGLARYGRQHRLYETLVGGLAAGCDVGELAAAVRRLAGETDALDDALAFCATALFARTPGLRFPAPS